MPYTFNPNWKNNFCSHEFSNFFKPVDTISLKTPLRSRGNRPLKMEFIHELKALVFFHLEEHKSGRHLIQDLQEDQFARKEIAPKDGIQKSSFFEAINTRGLSQLIEVFHELQKKTVKLLPKEHTNLGDLVVIDGSLIQATLSMHWADYRKRDKKAKVHLGFDINHRIPQDIYLSNGKGNERPFVTKILQPDQTGIMDRGYQCHRSFDRWQNENQKFVCRIRAHTRKELIRENEIKAGSIVFYDKIVKLGDKTKYQTKKEVRVVGYRVDNNDYWVATNRFDLSAEEIAYIYKLRWNIEIFFAWWKRHLKVYHLIARSEYGVLTQILGGLITYLLLAIYCRQEYNEYVSIRRVRQLRNKIRNEIRNELSAIKKNFPNEYNYMSKNNLIKNFVYANL